MRTVLSMVLLQISSAYRSAIMRCSPTVVPVLPPTGVAGVGSLKPTPASSVVWITKVAFASAPGAWANEASRTLAPTR